MWDRVAPLLIACALLAWPGETPRADEAWERTFGGELEDKLYGLAPTADGGGVATGHSLSFGGVRYKAWTLKLDATGEAAWAQANGGADVDHGYGVVGLPNGGALVAGQTRPQPRRTLLHQDQALPAHRNPIRKTRRQLPRHAQARIHTRLDPR